MVQEETDQIKSQMQSLEAQLEILLLPKDPLDERSIMLEVHYALTAWPALLEMLLHNGGAMLCCLNHDDAV